MRRRYFEEPLTTSGESDGFTRGKGLHYRGGFVAAAASNLCLCRHISLTQSDGGLEVIKRRLFSASENTCNCKDDTRPRATADLGRPIPSSTLPRKRHKTWPQWNVELFYLFATCGRFAAWLRFYRADVALRVPNCWEQLWGLLRISSCRLGWPFRSIIRASITTGKQLAIRRRPSLLLALRRHVIMSIGIFFFFTCVIHHLQQQESFCGLPCISGLRLSTRVKTSVR